MFLHTVLYPTKALVQLGGEIKKWAEAKQFTIPTLADTVSSATPLTLLYCLHTIHCHQKKGPITKKYPKPVLQEYGKVDTPPTALLVTLFPNYLVYDIPSLH